MNKDTINKKPHKYSWLIILLVSFLFTLLLFYIDEGAYNFNWIASKGNWIIFIIYSAILFVVQSILLILLRNVKNKFGKWSTVIVGGLGMGILLAVTVIFK